MSFFSFSEIRLIIAKSTNSNNISIPYLTNGGIKQKFFSQRISLIKTLKTYIKKYCQNADKYNVLYLSILYLDIILSKNKISLSHDKNLKYLCLCCFLLSLKFIGNYDTSKKIISNFCRNYKQEYRIFEIQCLILLEHNLVYTTAYNFLNMILIKEPKNLVSICNSILYQICEENIYTYYSPFYISVAIFQIAKNSINYNNHNHYDKYFHDERVKCLVKKLKNSINPPTIKAPSIDRNNVDDDNIKNNLNKTITNTNTNINIITNNNIQNNIVIINTICKKKSDNNFNKNSSFFISNNAPMKIIFKGNNNKLREEIFNKNNNNNNNNYNDNNNNNNNDNNNNNIDNNYDKEPNNNTEENIINRYNNYENIHNNKITISASKDSNNILSKSHFKIFRTNNSKNNFNNHKTINIKETNKKRPNFKINSFLHSSKCLSNSNKKKYEQNSFELKKLCYNKTYKEETLSTEIQTPNQISNNHINSEKQKIYANKSSLNFQLVSGVPKEKLVKLSRNLSKTMVNDKVQTSNFDKVNK